MVARSQGPGLAIGGLKVGAEAAEEFRHGQVGLPVPVIDRRVEEDGLARGVKGHVAAPEVAVQQGGLGGMVDQRRAYLREPPAAVLETAAKTLGQGQIELGLQAPRPPEGCPVPVLGIGLGRGADEVVPVPAEPGLALAVELRQSPAGLGATFPPRPAEGEVFQDQKGLLPRQARSQRGRYADGFGRRQGLQPRRFRLEHGESLGVVELDEPGAGPVAEHEGAVDAAAAELLGGARLAGLAREGLDVGGDLVPVSHGA